MKKLLASILVSLGMFVMVPMAASAAPVNPAHTDVTGTVTDNGNPVDNALVTVTCGTSTLSDTTGSDGTYLVDFFVPDCHANSTVSVHAQKGAIDGFNTGTASPITTRLNVAIVNVAVPEMGIVTGAAATAAASGAFLVIRRRKSVEQE